MSELHLQLQRCHYHYHYHYMYMYILQLTILWIPTPPIAPSLSVPGACTTSIKGAIEGAGAEVLELDMTYQA